MQDVKDITIVGAGPTGLFGAFYAGMRGASCCLIDNLDQVGGQLTALYPEKYIFDVAGFPKVLAKDLVRGMAEQALQFHAPVHLGEQVTGLERSSENGHPFFTIVTERDAYPSRTVLIAGGIGVLVPGTARLAATLSGIMLFSWVFLVHIPLAINTHTVSEVSRGFQALQDSAVAFMLAGTLGSRKP